MASFAKVLLRQLKENDLFPLHDQVYFYNARLFEITQSILDMDYLLIEVDPLYTELISQQKEKYIQQKLCIIDQRKKLLRKLHAVHCIIIDFIIQSTNFIQLENLIRNKKFLMSEYSYVMKILSNLEIAFKNNQAKLVIKRLKIEHMRQYIKENRFNYSLLNIEPCVEVVEEDYIGDYNFNLEKKVRKSRSVIVDHSNILIGPLNRQVDIYPNIFLKDRIRSILYAFSEARKPRTLFNRFNNALIYYKNKFLNYIYNHEEQVFEMDEYAQPQMDAHGEDPPDKDRAGNVVLTESRKESSVVSEKATFNWCKVSSSDVVGKYSEMTDRYLRVGQFVWTKNLAAQTLIKSYILPRDVIINSQWKACSIPNTIPFLVHRYWRGDMEIKIQLNSNKFQIGQLQCVWYFEPWLDDKFYLRNTLQSGSQTLHTLISAGASNEASFIVNFKHHLPLISNKRRSDYDTVLGVGELLIYVMNPLSVPDGGPDRATGSIFVRFMNNEFTGQLSGDIDPVSVECEHHMNNILGSLVGGASSILNGALSGAVGGLQDFVLGSSHNADQPIDISPPMYVVPTAAHSWAAGTGSSSQMHPLRLDVRGQTLHPDMSSYEGDIKSIVQKYGFISTLNWSVNDSAGKLLQSYDAGPIFDLDAYLYTPDDDINSGKCYYMPPVAVISSMFMMWRGSLNFRFDIIASQFHSGRLLIGYVPGATSATSVTIEKVLAGPHMVFSLQESQQFVYKIPFIADRPFWNRQFTGNSVTDKMKAPSRVYIFVLNPLVIMESVVDKVFINVYFSGADNFEVAIPVQPSLGLAYNNKIVHSNVLFANKGNFPYKLGPVDALKDNTQACALVVKDRTPAAFPVKYFNDSNLESFYIYESVNPKQTVKWRVPPMKGDPTWFVYIKYKNTMVFCPINGTDIDAVHAMQWYFKNSGDQFINDWNARYGITENNIKSDYAIADGFYIHHKRIAAPKINIVADFELVTHQGEREEAINVITTETGLTSTMSGLCLFGESFNDLKDLCRRYQVYASAVLTPSANIQLGQASVILPLLPQGLDLMLTSQGVPLEFSNRCRDGHIPIVLSGFRYFRGGLRMKIVVPSTRDLILWIQHRPDRKLRSNSLIPILDVTTAEMMANHTYASYIQDTGVNSIIEFEIPFYQNSAFGLLQRPRILSTNEAFYYSLGELAIGCVYTKLDTDLNNKSFVGTCYYSLADDFAFSTFQGFPPVMVLDKIQGKDSVVCEHQGLWDSITGKVKNTVKEEVASTIHEYTGIVNDEVEKHVLSIKDQISGLGFTSLMESSVVRVVMAQISQVMVNTNKKSVCIGICFVLLELGVLTTQMIESLMVHLLSICRNVKISMSGSEPNQPDNVSIAEEAAHHMEISEDDEAVTGIITIVWSAMCSIFCITSRQPKDLKSFSTLLTKDLKGVLSSSNCLFIFLRNIFSVIKAMKKKLLGICIPSLKIIDELNEYYPEMKAWAEEVVYLDDPKNFDNLRYTPQYKSRVNMCYSIGVQQYNKVSLISEPKISRPVIELYNKIKDLREKIVETGDDYYVRKEPFVVWQCGDAGIGKSTLTHDIALHMLAARSIKPSVPPIYNHNVSSDYWDSCQNNPVMVVDDMFNIQSGDMFEKQLATLFSVVSPVVLCPPKARIEDKGKPYNPEIFIINSNYDFLRFNNIHMDAIHRRRHMLVTIKLSDRKKKECDHCNRNLSVIDASPLDLADYHHLDFFIAKNVMSPDTTWQGPLTYLQYLDLLSSNYITIMDKNESLYRKRVLEVLNLLSLNPEDGIASFDTAFERMKRKQMFEYRKAYEESVLGQVVDCISLCSDSAKGMYARMKTRLSLIFLHPLEAQKENELVTSSGEKVTYSKLVAIFDKIEKQNIFAENQSDDAVKVLLSPYKYRNATALLSDINFNVKDKFAYNTYLGVFTELDLARMRILHENGPSNFSYDQILKFFCVSLEEMNVRSFGWGSWCVRWLNLRESVKLNVLNRGIKTNDPELEFCYHWLMDPEDVVYNDEGEMFYKNQNIMFECDEPHVCCGFNNIVYQHLWFEEYLALHGSIRRDLQIQTRISQERIPIVFRRYDVFDLPDDTTWHTLLQNIKYELKRVFLGGKKLLSLFFSGIKSAWKFLKVIFQFSSLFLPGLFMIAGSVMAYKATTRINEAKMEKENIWSEQQAPSYSSQHINLNTKPVVATSQNNVQQLPIILCRLKNNMFRIIGVDGEKEITCVGIVLCTRRLLLLKHFVEEMCALSSTTLYYGKFYLRDGQPKNVKGIDFKFRDLVFKYFSYKVDGQEYESNLVVAELPLMFPESKSIVNFIATQKDHERVRGEGMFFKNDGIVYDNLHVRREKKNFIIKERGFSSQVTLVDVYTYSIQERGFCGSILLSKELERPIIGIHVAGVEYGNIRGISEILTRDMFSFSPTPAIPYEDVVSPLMKPVDDAKIDLEDVFVYGCVDDKFASFQLGKTRIRKSAVHGIVPVTTEPAPLKQFDKRLPPGSSPLVEGIKHMSKYCREFPNHILENACNHYLEKILTMVVPLKSISVLSYQEAICGIHNCKGYEPLEWSTSPGYPLKALNKGKSGKKYLFDLEETPQGFVLHGMDETLETLINTENKLRRQNIKPFTIFTDCLKDSCISIEKCSIPGKTRIFSVAPVQYTIVFKQYFGDFMAAFQRTRLDAEHAIGIDVNSLEWTELAKLLMSKGNNIICGDYKNYGPSILLSVAEKAFSIIFEWYRVYEDPQVFEQNDKVRRVLAYEMLQGMHLALNVIYNTPCGIVSGSPITTPLNSMIGSLYLYCMWPLITNECYNVMDENIAIVTYGDDVCISVSDMFRDKFNTLTLNQEFSKYNIVFTDCDKSGDIIPYRTIETASFLKCNFKQHYTRSGLYIAVLDEHSIFSCINWIHGTGLIADATVENCEQALLLAHGHGKQYYELLFSKLKIKCNELKLIFRYKTWEDIDRERYSIL